MYTGRCDIPAHLAYLKESRGYHLDAELSFGLWLKRRRAALDLTQRALAQLSGVTVEAIRKIEADRLRPSRHLAERLADSLAVPSAEHAWFLELSRAKAYRTLPALPHLTPPPSPAQQLPSLRNLPLPSTPLIGRARELANLRASLLRDD